VTFAQSPQVQPGIGPTGSMYNGNNLARSAIAPRPDANRPPPPSGGGVTGAQSSRTEGGTGAGGGEH
jgi:hypothetical protein